MHPSHAHYITQFQPDTPVNPYNAYAHNITLNNSNLKHSNKCQPIQPAAHGVAAGSAFKATSPAANPTFCGPFAMILATNARMASCTLCDVTALVSKKSMSRASASVWWREKERRMKMRNSEDRRIGGCPIHGDSQMKMCCATLILFNLECLANQH
jgi:hypothetical protein